MTKEKDFFHMNKRTVKTGRTAEKNKYNQRLGKHAKKRDLLTAGHANLPEGVGLEEFFTALDKNDRKNGGATEVRIALPRGFNQDQQRLLAEELAAKLAGPCPVSWAVHNPKAALEGGDQPHLHALICRRVPDGIARPLTQIFRRYNPSDPQRGGWRKNTGGPSRTAVREALKAERAVVSAVLNVHLETNGRSERVDHRSFRDRNIQLAPSRHLGSKKVWKMKKEQK